MKNAETRDRLLARLLDSGGRYGIPMPSNGGKRIVNDDDDDIPRTPKELQLKDSRTQKNKSTKTKRIVKKATSITPNKSTKKVAKVKVNTNSKKTKKNYDQRFKR